MLKPIERRKFLIGGAVLASCRSRWGAKPSWAAREQIVVRIETDIVNLDPGSSGRLHRGQRHPCLLPGSRPLQPRLLDWSPDAAKTQQKSDTEIEFELNPGQGFSGGYGEITAEDLKFTFDRFIHGDAQGNKLAYADDLGAIGECPSHGHLYRTAAPQASVAVALGGRHLRRLGAILSKKAVEELATRSQLRDRLRALHLRNGGRRSSSWLEANPDYKGGTCDVQARRRQADPRTRPRCSPSRRKSRLHRDRPGCRCPSSSRLRIAHD